MTAVNVILRRDKAIMLTDGAYYTSTGIMTGVADKAFAMPTMGAVVAVRGMQLLGTRLAMLLPMEFPDVDAVIQEGEERFAALLGSSLNAIRQSPFPDVAVADQFDIVICGWSQKLAKSRGVYYSTRTQPSFGEIDEWAFGPFPSNYEWSNLARLRCEIDRDVAVDDFEGDVHGIPLMEAQRRMAIDPELSKSPSSYSIIGGNVLLTEVDATGIRQRIVHAWDDKLDERIAPEPFDPSKRWSKQYMVDKLAVKAAKRQGA